MRAMHDGASVLRSSGAGRVAFYKMRLAHVHTQTRARAQVLSRAGTPNYGKGVPAHLQAQSPGTCKLRRLSLESV
eukprot:CAMPEP_0175401542 /NCGR_PEP_ID=MMETSP0095-20121207/37062_1 /TAXON_ID=311494 /ORGANISM="Alexandrium monilatum, Strain CCMP3105" /LENGTH=74 /DNA_ID=CAMNT_0016700295 /DNA_START=33 /DNA_END=255 /DNA_ORIENTATION=-